MISLLLALAMQGPQKTPVKVENTLPVSREETVAILWKQPNARVTDAATGKEVLSQILGDSILFVASLTPNETHSYTVEAVAPTGKITPRVHAKFVPEREDVAWENDRVAFRIYGKKLWELENLHSNGIDAWEKRTRSLVLDAWYDKGHDSYHIDSGEGADFFQVGPTLGAGGTGVWKDNKLFRGDNFLNHKIVVDGPLRTVFELEYGAIDVAGRKVTERKRVSIDAGQNYFKQESTFTSDAPGDLDIVVGLVKRPLEKPDVIGATSKNRDIAWLLMWGAIEKRTKGHGDLGTAVLVAKKDLVDFEEINDHYLTINRIAPNQTLTSYVASGWTATRDFNDFNDWWRYVDNLALRLATPVVVSVGK